MEFAQRTNKYGVDSRREYQRLYQRDYRRAKRETNPEQDNPPLPRIEEQSDLMMRGIRFCHNTVEQGIVSLPKEFAEQLNTITDKAECLRTWCEIYGF
jgi:hypothetical protein